MDEAQANIIEFTFPELDGVPYVHLSGRCYCRRVVVFYLGLGVGLTQSPTYGSILWVVAGLIAALNLLWIALPRR